MKFENIRVYNFENAFRGMRNPKNYWNKSDSIFGIGTWDEHNEAVIKVAERWLKHQGYDLEEISDDIYTSCVDTLYDNSCLFQNDHFAEWACIGPKDMNLAQTLILGGSEHRKFMRQIFVSVDITAPLYWWKEFDTYKVCTVANSTSTMHTIQNHPITLDCFEIDDFHNIEYPVEVQRPEIKSNADPDFIQMCLIPYLEYLRTIYNNIQKEIKETSENIEELENKAKIVWKELIRWLPESWLQKRTVTMSYENLFAMCSKGQRRFHKLTEWSGDGDEFVTESFIKFARSLPYAQNLIFIDELKYST